MCIRDSSRTRLFRRIPRRTSSCKPFAGATRLFRSTHLRTCGQTSWRILPHQLDGPRRRHSIYYLYSIIFSIKKEIPVNRSGFFIVVLCGIIIFIKNVFSALFHYNFTKLLTTDRSSETSLTKYIPSCKAETSILFPIILPFITTVPILSVLSLIHI